MAEMIPIVVNWTESTLSTAIHVVCIRAMSVEVLRQAFVERTEVYRQRYEIYCQELEAWENQYRESFAKLTDLKRHRKLKPKEKEELQRITALKPPLLDSRCSVLNHEFSMSQFLEWSSLKSCYVVRIPEIQELSEWFNSRLKR